MRTINILLAAGAVLWFAINLLFKPDPAIARRFAASDRQLELLRYHAIDTANLWQLQLASFNISHPLLPGGSRLVRLCTQLPPAPCHRQAAGPGSARPATWPVLCRSPADGMLPT